MRYRDLLGVKWSKRLRRRPHRPRLRRRVNRPSRWLEQIRRAALCSGQTSAGRRGKTRGRSTHDRIVRHRGYARQAPGLCWFARSSTISHRSSTSCGLAWKTKYRWELHSHGLPEGYDKLVVADIIALLIEALKGIGATDSKLIRPRLKPTTTIPAAPTPPDQTPPHSAVSDFPIGWVKGVFDVTT